MPTDLTLYLTSASSRLVTELSAAMPDVQVVVIGDSIPTRREGNNGLCFVDWLLPTTSGLEMCRRLKNRPETAEFHITMVLDDDNADARRRALRAGADDYLPGPLTREKLTDRLQTYCAGTHQKVRPRLVHGALAVDLAAHHARWHGAVIALRPTEFRLLAHFVEHPDQVFTRSALIAVLGKDEEGLDERTVDVWVGRLRRALKSHGVPDPLRTVRSYGYVLDGIAAEDWRAAS